MDTIIQNSRKYSLMLVVISVLLILFNSRLGWVRNNISYLYSDYAYSQIEAGSNLKGYLTLFGDVVEIRNRNEDLESENIRLRSELDSLNVKVDELTHVKNSSQFINSSKRYLNVQMFIKVDGQNGYITEGTRRGVKVGGVVQFAQYYIGQITKVDTNGGLVRLPQSRSSYIKVAIVKPLNLEKVTEKSLIETVRKQTRSVGVAVGKGDKVVIENITVDKGVVDGDLIVINDEKIGRYLILGTITGLGTDPASSSLTSGVELPVNYDYINSYIIEIDE